MRTSKEAINYIMKLAKEKDISQAELARMVDMSEATLSRYVNYKREFPINDIGKFAVALNVPLYDLLGIEVEKKKYEFRNLEMLINLLSEIGSLNRSTLDSPAFQEKALVAMLADLKELIRK